MNKSKVLKLSFVLLFAAVSAAATENAPHAPFAQWADLPASGQFVVGAFFQESEAYHIWAGSTYHDVNWRKDGQDYGIDITQGYFTLQYGLTEKWAADLPWATPPPPGVTSRMTATPAARRNLLPA